MPVVQLREGVIGEGRVSWCEDHLGELGEETDGDVHWKVRGKMEGGAGGLNEKDVFFRLRSRSRASGGAERRRPDSSAGLNFLSRDIFER